MPQSEHVVPKSLVDFLVIYQGCVVLVDTAADIAGQGRSTEKEQGRQ